MKKILPVLFILFVFINEGCSINSCSNTNKIIDKDGNIYDAVRIGKQVWMKQNLTTSHYNNGDLIPQVTDPTAWVNLTTGAWCYYNNDSLNGKIYGKLYNWYAVNDSRGLAPTKCHIPSDSEWTILSNVLGGELKAGDKMKETGITHWIGPNTYATNSSGFTALPSGYCYGYFRNINSRAIFWSSTLVGNVTPWIRYLYEGDRKFTKGNEDKRNGYSVRCLKD